MKLKMPEIFQNGMILQRNKPLHIWGSALPGDTVTVTIDHCSQRTEACDGTWCIVFPARDAAVNLTMTVSTGSGEMLKFENIGIGEVWLAGGQSNMEFMLEGDCSREEAVKTADSRWLRFYNIPKLAYEGQPQEEVDYSLSIWRSADPDSVQKFSAVAYYFAKEIKDYLGEVPVGIIVCCWSGTSACAWLDEVYFTGDLAVYMDEYRKIAPLSQAVGEIQEPLELPEMLRLSRFQLLRMRQSHCTPVSPYRPAGLYHTMLSRVMPYTLAGFLWYQGEDDVDRPHLYGQLFTRMIRCWRDGWHEELPFLYVQLPGLYASMLSWGCDFIPIREQQALVEHQVENVYMACTMDVGDRTDVHPKNKHPVGHRLALLARNKIYGEDILSQSPELFEGILKKDRIRLKFLYFGDGLFVNGDQIQALDVILDGIVQNHYKVHVYKDSIDIDLNYPGKKAEVRMAWVDFCNDNLYNSSGLPVKPFRVLLEDCDG